MNVTEAIRHIDGMVFRDGWHMRASAAGSGMVEVTFAIDTTDTSYPDRDGRCRDKITLRREATINVAKVDGLPALCYELLKCTRDIDLHEDREFLKVRGADGRWYAPLHPHTYAGETAWQQAGGSAGITISDDLDGFSMALLEAMERAR